MESLLENLMLAPSFLHLTLDITFAVGICLPYFLWEELKLPLPMKPLVMM